MPDFGVFGGFGVPGAGVLGVLGTGVLGDLMGKFVVPSILAALLGMAWVRADSWERRDVRDMVTSMVDLVFADGAMERLVRVSYMS